MVNMRWELAPWSEPWTGPAPRRASSFRANWDQTLALLATETKLLDSGLVLIEIDVRAEHLTRNHQALLSGHSPTHPGVRISFDSTHGELAYTTAQFWDWRHNVRAIALSLEQLRAIDRWGVSHGAQYVGFRPAIAAGESVKFSTAKEAAAWLATMARELGVEAGAPADLYRRVSRILHPDADQAKDADADGMLWIRLQAAKIKLDEAGVI